MRYQFETTELMYLRTYTVLQQQQQQHQNGVHLFGYIGVYMHSEGRKVFFFPILDKVGCGFWVIEYIFLSEQRTGDFALLLLPIKEIDVCIL